MARLVTTPRGGPGQYLADKLPENTVFTPKNGVSALLMRALWESAGLQRFNYVFDDNPAHRADVMRALAPIGENLRRLDANLNAPAGDPFLGAARHSYALVQTLSLEHVVKPVSLRLPWRVPRYVAQHGTVELEAYLKTCLGMGPTWYSGYVLLFRDEVLSYLRRKGAHPRVPAYSYPERELLQTRSRAAAGEGKGLRRTLFSMQCILDTGTVTEDILKTCISNFLDRREPMHYCIKLHPRPCGRTTEALTRELTRRKLSYEILPADTAMMELSFPEMECQEVSTFYSSAALFCNKIYGVAFDTMLPELRHTKILKPRQQTLIATLHDVLASSSNSGQYSDEI